MSMKNKKRNSIIIFSFILSFITLFVCGYVAWNRLADSCEHIIVDYRIYKNTPAWELACAVKKENTQKIEKIVKENPELLNYQDPKYGATLLIWSVGTERYKSAETLLKCGADPNIKTYSDPDKQKYTAVGETALYIASGYSWVDNDAKKDPKYVKLLLKYGADPNINYVGFENSVSEPGESPLMYSIGCGIEKTKALVEGGADINYKTKSGICAADMAILWHEQPEYAYYLIVEKKADITKPICFMDDDTGNEKFYIVDSLRSWIYPINSPEYKIKMEIVKEFERQGVNYWDTKIPEPTLEIIKKTYPDTWKEYIKQY